MSDTNDLTFASLRANIARVSKKGVRLSDGQC
jgi:hypothetical protein